MLKRGRRLQLFISIFRHINTRFAKKLEYNAGISAHSMDSIFLLVKMVNISSAICLRNYTLSMPPLIRVVIMMMFGKQYMLCAMYFIRLLYRSRHTSDLHIGSTKKMGFENILRWLSGRQNRWVENLMRNFIRKPYKTSTFFIIINSNYVKPLD